MLYARTNMLVVPFEFTKKRKTSKIFKVQKPHQMLRYICSTHCYTIEHFKSEFYFYFLVLQQKKISKNRNKIIDLTSLTALIFKKKREENTIFLKRF